VSRIAFLGLGRMGSPMARRLLDAGHDVRVWNRTADRALDLVGSGAEQAGTPADAAKGAEIAITMLSDPAALEEVLFGRDGVAEAIPSDATFIDMSTVGPNAIRAAAARLRPVETLDAPVLGSVPHAEAGTLSILVGGDADVLRRCEDVLRAMGTVRHIGPLGAGATVKLAGNAAVMSTMVCLGEVLGLTDRGGVDQEVVFDAIGMGPLGSFIERFRDRALGLSNRIDFRLALARKDLALVLDEAERAGLRLSIPDAAAARCDEAIASGLGERDNTVVVGSIRGRVGSGPSDAGSDPEREP